MRVLVSDTSILIDLERADLLRAAFSLDAEFVVPDLLYERELRDSGGAGLLALGLRIESLDARCRSSDSSSRTGATRATSALPVAASRN